MNLFQRSCPTLAVLWAVLQGTTILAQDAAGRGQAERNELQDVPQNQVDLPGQPSSPGSTPDPNAQSQLPTQPQTQPQRNGEVPGTRPMQDQPANPRPMQEPQTAPGEVSGTRSLQDQPTAPRPAQDTQTVPGQAPGTRSFQDQPTAPRQAQDQEPQTTPGQPQPPAGRQDPSQPTKVVPVPVPVPIPMPAAPAPVPAPTVEPEPESTVPSQPRGPRTVAQRHYESSMQTRWKTAADDIARLRSHRNTLKGKQLKAFQESLQTASGNRSMARTKLNQLIKGSAADWDKLKTGVERAFTDLDASIERARSHLQTQDAR